MAAIGEIANKVNNCSGKDVNTGKLGCNIQFGEPRHLIGLKAGTIIPATTNFNQEYINTLVQAGVAVPLIGASAFEPLSSEDSMFTYSSGIEIQNLQGYAKYRLTFDSGHHYYKELAKLKGFKNLDFIIGDNEGNWRLVLRSDGDYKGFQAGMVLPEITKDRVSGGDPESKSLVVQFISRREWDEDYDILLRDNLDNDPEDFQGVNAVDLAYDVVPSDTDTTLVVSAVLESDKTTKVEGLDENDFLVTVDSVTAVISGVVEVDGVYTITIPALATAEVVDVRLYDSSVNKDVIIEPSGVTYRSNILSATVV
jgi:hypothetical protein